MTAQSLTNIPAQKVVASGISGALVTILVFVLDTYVLETPLPGPVVGAILTVVTFAVGYLVPPHEREIGSAG